MAKLLSVFKKDLEEAKRNHPSYGNKRDYPKRHIMVNGNYHSTTTWARTGQQAKDEFVKKYPEHATSKIHIVKEGEEFDSESDEETLELIYEGEVLQEEEHDEHAVHELTMHADNDSHLYHSSHIPIVHNLEKKYKKGTYDRDKAKKLWKYHADRAAQSYHKEHGDPSQKWHHMFSTATRKKAAEHFEHHHHTEMEAGNFHDR